MPIKIHHVPVLLLVSCCGMAHAGYKDDIGYTRLLIEQGANLPDGSGVHVTQAEASTSGEGNPAVFLPDNVNVAELAGKIVTDQSGSTTGTFSSHATGVAKTFYGNTSSIAAGISAINAYLADSWLQSDFLRFGSVPDKKPLSSSDRIANHSWIGSYADVAYDSEVLRRTDWLVETDEFIQCVGVRNSSNANQPLLSGAYNVIAVGKSDGLNGYGTTQLDSDYVSGRTRPEIVAPKSTSSTATPVVAAAAALLVELGNNNPGLSTDPVVTSTTSRNGNTVNNAERSEVIKAALMAGADRVTSNSSSADITDYRADPANQTVNGLDSRYGAGQINIYNSFHIIAAGEQNSDEDDAPGSGVIGLSGFDYDPSFGGAGGSNPAASYRFSAGENAVAMSATLAWNIAVDGGNGSGFSGGTTLHNLDLYLYDISDGGQVLLQSSASSVDNTETIRAILDAGRDYLLQVAGQGSFDWDYALAWQMVVLVDTDGDGIPDAVDMDDDNDGLPDADEAIYGTNPLVADSDSDGFGDGMEVAYGSNPVLDTDTPASNHINNGDINNDGVVDVVDVLLATRIVLDQYTPTDTERVRADMVPDNQINAGDLVRIQQLALGL
jgi:hypothetical protein